MHGKFDEQLPFALQPSSKGFKLKHPIRFRSAHMHAWIQVPEGKSFDVKPSKYARARILRAWLYSQGSIFSAYGMEQIVKTDADDVYLEALAACGASRIRLWLAYLKCELTGYKQWDACRQLEEDLVS